MGINVKHVNVEIKKSLVDTIVKTVMIHEVPILIVKHGESKVLPCDYQPKSEAEGVDVADELNRLVSCYGREIDENGDKGDPIAEVIYGNQRALDSVDEKESSLAKHMRMKDLNKFFSGLDKKFVDVPATNSEEGDKAFKANLTKPQMLAWLKEQGIETVGETIEAVEAVEAVEEVKAVKAVKASEGVEAVEAVKGIKAVEAVEGVEGVEAIKLSNLPAPALTKVAKEIMTEMILDFEKPFPDDSMGTKTMSKVVIGYQEEG